MAGRDVLRTKSGNVINVFLYGTTELIASDKNADDDIVHLGGLREANRFPRQTFDPRP